MNTQSSSEALPPTTGSPSSDGEFIAAAKKWCEEIINLSDGEVVCKLADMLAENHGLKTQLAAAHKALMVCDGAMMGKVKPSSVAFRLIREILYPENAKPIRAGVDSETN